MCLYQHPLRRLMITQIFAGRGWWARLDSNQRRREAAGLQPAAIAAMRLAHMEKVILGGSKITKTPLLCFFVTEVQYPRRSFALTSGRGLWIRTRILKRVADFESLNRLLIKLLTKFLLDGSAAATISPDPYIKMRFLMRLTANRQ